MRRYLKIHRYPNFLWRTARSFFESTKGAIFFYKKFLLSKKFYRLTKQKSKELFPYYKKYCSEVSGDYMAISFELAVFILVLCEILKPKSILDLGSGFSSFVFRYYKKNAESNPTVWSLDDNSEWLKKTKNYLNDQRLSTENMAVWYPGFLKNNNQKFDFVSHDLGNMALRKEAFREVLESMDINGVVILDDIHKYDTFVKNFMSKYNYEYYNLKYYTKDKFGRYSVLVTH